ncbi:MAG: L-threonylcarbamoyladenylate synthase [Patescibacteria group bacterium]|jgi:L-threonylcarbamoyladenylate synthase
MEIIRESEPEAISRCVQVLQNGGVLAIPTETAYGLACDPRNRIALAKIYKIKQRDQSKALPLIACSKEQVANIFEIPAQAQDLITKYWPGPLTILLAPADMMMRKSMPVFKDGLAAVRVSSHPFVQKLTCEYGFPLTATSANLADNPPCMNAEEIQIAFKNNSADLQPDLIVDGGVLPDNPASTIIKFMEDGRVEVVRQGGIQI